MMDTQRNEKTIISYLTFTLAGEHFALNVSKVVNILEMQHITRVPKAPEYMPGIINLRGEVLPVIDANTKLGNGSTQTTNSTCILVIESQQAEGTIRFGAMVDSVQEVLEFEDQTILPSPTIGNSYRTDLISGVVEEAGHFIMILDIDKFLSAGEASRIKSASAEQIPV